jgi:hypothetical protein
LPRRYFPAPPPISFRASPAGPPVPDVARRAAPDTRGAEARGAETRGAETRGPTALEPMAGHASLVQATAELFRSMRSNQSTNSLLDDGTGGPSVSAPNSYSYSRNAGIDGLDFPDPVQPPAIPSQEMERLVDTVVEKIEQRVIDELERRGRRHNPGVF